MNMIYDDIICRFLIDDNEILFYCYSEYLIYILFIILIVIIYNILYCELMIDWLCLLGGLVNGIWNVYML